MNDRLMAHLVCTSSKCGRRYKTDDQRARRGVPCPSCGAELDVYAPAAPAAPAAATSTKYSLRDLIDAPSTPARQYVRFACEHCHAESMAAADKAGQMGTCPKCRQKTQILQRPADSQPPPTPGNGHVAVSEPADDKRLRAREAEERARREAEAKARQEAEQQAKKEAEAQAQREAEAKVKKEAQAKAQREAELQTRKDAEELAKQQVEANARREAELKAQREIEERTRREAEAKAQREAEQRAKKEAEERAQRAAEAKAQREATVRAKKEAEEQARREAKARAQREAEQRAKKEAEAKARREAELRARKEAEEQARREAEAKAQREAEQRTRQEAEERARRDAEEQARAAAEERDKRLALERIAQEDQLDAQWLESIPALELSAPCPWAPHPYTIVKAVRAGRWVRNRFRLPPARLLAQPLGKPLLGVRLTADVFATNGFRYLRLPAAAAPAVVAATTDALRERFARDPKAAQRAFVSVGYESAVTLTNVGSFLNDLQRPRKRLVRELFWPHVSAELFESLRSTRNLASWKVWLEFSEAASRLSGREHILAVHAQALAAHCLAITGECGYASGNDAVVGRFWPAAWECWEEVLAAEEFWDYLHERAETLAVAADLDEIRRRLPGVLLGFHSLFAQAYALAGDDSGCQRHLSLLNQSPLASRVDAGSEYATVASAYW